MNELKYFFFRLYLRLRRAPLFSITYSHKYYRPGDWMMTTPNVWIVNLGNSQYITLQDFKKYGM